MNKIGCLVSFCLVVFGLTICTLCAANWIETEVLMIPDTVGGIVLLSAGCVCTEVFDRES